MRRIEKRGEVNVLCDDYGCSPATKAEAEFFDEITRLRAENARQRGLLLWVLYHHQGGSSPVGQTIRRALGIGQFDHLTPEQVRAATIAGERTC